MDSDDGRLIDLVRIFKVIYDRSDALFKNKVARRNAWRTIGEQLGLTEEECEQRWNVLRTRYNTEIRNFKMGPTSEGVRKRKWPLFDNMSFLNAHIVQKKTWRHVTAAHRKNETQNSNISNYAEVFEDSHSKISLPLDPYEVQDASENKQIIYNIPEFVSINSPGSPYRTPSQIIPVHSTPKIDSTVRTEVAKNGTKGLNSDCSSSTTGVTVDSLTSYFNYKPDTMTENADMCFAKQVYFYLQEIVNEKQKKKVKRKILDIFIDEESN